MLRIRLFQACLLSAALVCASTAGAVEMIFLQDFGCDGTGDENCGGVATTPQTWNQLPNTWDPGDGGETYQSNNPTYVGVVETIRVDGDTRSVTSTPAAFSVTTRNWDIHNGEQNPWVSGYRDGSNTDMQGNMLGHVDANYSNWEDNFYQIDGIILDADLTDIQLMFSYDSWIEDDIDGFAVAFSFDGGADFDLLNPTGSSDMQYRDLGDSDQSLNNLVGEAGPDVMGFDGHEPNGDMAGTAMFDLSAVGAAGQTLSLRFAFASNGSSQQEGINIDNIKVTGTCPPGSSGPNCGPPGTVVPEPGSLALALLGLTAIYRHRKKAR